MDEEAELIELAENERMSRYGISDGISDGISNGMRGGMRGGSSYDSYDSYDSYSKVPGAIFGGVEYAYKDTLYYSTLRRLEFANYKEQTKNTASESKPPNEWFIAQYGKQLGAKYSEIVSAISPEIDLRFAQTIDMIDVLEIYCSQISDDRCAECCSIQTLDIDDLSVNSLTEIAAITERIVNYINGTNICGVPADISCPQMPSIVIEEKTFPQRVSNMEELSSAVAIDIKLAAIAREVEEYYMAVITTMNAVCEHIEKIISVK